MTEYFAHTTQNHQKGSINLGNIGYHPNPFYRISNTLWLKQICPDAMELDEALYHITVLVDIAEQQASELKRLK